MRFTQKIKLISLATALFPLLLATIIVTLLARAELFHQAEAKLMAVREIKKQQVQTLFQDFAKGLTTVRAVAEQSSDQNPQALDLVLAKMASELGFYDIFLIDPQGTIVYSVARESDYQTNLLDGPYRDSGLHASAESDHSFRSNPITHFGLIRSPISVLSDHFYPFSEIAVRNAGITDRNAEMPFFF